MLNPERFSELLIALLSLEIHRYVQLNLVVNQQEDSAVWYWPFTILDTWMTSMSWSCSQYQGQEAGSSQRPRVVVPQQGSPTALLPTLGSAPRSSTSLEGCKAAA